MIDPRRKDWTEKDWMKDGLLKKKAWDDVFEEKEADSSREESLDKEKGETQMNWRDKIDEETRTLKRYFRMSEKTEKAPCACQDTSNSEDVTNLAWLKVAKKVDPSKEASRDNEEGKAQMTWQDKIDKEMESYPWGTLCVEKTEKAPCACQDTSDSENVTARSWLEAAKDSSSYGVKFLEEMSNKKKEEKEAMNVHEKNLERIEKFLGSNEDGISDTWYTAERKKHREMMEKSGLLRDIPSEDVMVHHPPHYERNGHECIDWIETALTPDEFKGYLKGCAYKYQWRHEEKGHRKRDLQKAQWYLRKLESLGEK